VERSDVGMVLQRETEERKKEKKKSKRKEQLWQPNPLTPFLLFSSLIFATLL
jgi:hypothetical protein